MDCSWTLHGLFELFIDFSWTVYGLFMDCSWTVHIDNFSA